MAAAGARAALAMRQKQKKMEAMHAAKKNAESLDIEQRDKLIESLSTDGCTLFIANLAQGKAPDAPKEVETEEVYVDLDWDGSVPWDDYEGVMPVARPHFLSEEHYGFIVRHSKGKEFDTSWFNKYIKYPPSPEDPRARKLALSVVEALAEAEGLERLTSFVEAAHAVSAVSAFSSKRDSIPTIGDEPAPGLASNKNNVILKTGEPIVGKEGRMSRSRSVNIKEGMDLLGPLGDAPAWVFRFNEFVYLNQTIVADVHFNALVVTCIIIAGILVGVQSYPAMDGNKGLAAIDATIQIIFTFECLFKIFAEGIEPWVYWTGPERSWNNFDFWLVTIVWLPLDGGNVAFLRLLRLMRLLKLVGKVKQLQVIVVGLAKGLSSVSYIMVLMVLIFYLFAVAGVDTFRENDPFHFGSLGVAMLTLFRCATLEDWSDVMYINYFGCDSQYSGVYGVYGGLNMESAPHEQLGTRQKGMGTQFGYFPMNECWSPKKQPMISTAFFILFILIAAFVMLSLFVGAVCGGMSEAMDAFKEEVNQALIARNAKVDEVAKSTEGAQSTDAQSLEAMREAFDSCDEDGSGEVDAEELVEAMSYMGVHMSVEVATATISSLDSDKNGTLGFDEFYKLMTGQDLSEPEKIETKRRSMKRASLNEEMMESGNKADISAEQKKKMQRVKENQDALRLVSMVKS